MEKKSLEMLAANSELQSSMKSNPENNPQLESHYITPWTCLQIFGPDTVDFLNRLLSIKVSLIPLQQGSWAFLLDHRGRVQESIYLLREDTQSFIAISEMAIQTLHDALDLFLFAEDLNLKILNDQQCIYSRFSTNTSTQDLLQTLFAHRHWPFKLMGNHHEYLSIGSKEQVIEFMKLHESSTLLSDTDFEHDRISLGIPQVLREYKDRNPLNVSIQGISEGKGCYPGQEVIEKTLALGKPAKRTLSVKVYASHEALHTLVQNYLKQEAISVLSVPPNSPHEQAKSLGLVTSLSPMIMNKDQESMSPFVCAIIQVKNRPEYPNDLVLSFPNPPPERFEVTIMNNDL